LGGLSDDDTVDAERGAKPDDDDDDEAGEIATCERLGAIASGSDRGGLGSLLSLPGIENAVDMVGRTTSERDRSRRALPCEEGAEEPYDPGGLPMNMPPDPKLPPPDPKLLPLPVAP
jgi:hypothetical protein